jgi:hypothetical protein
MASRSSWLAVVVGVLACAQEPATTGTDSSTTVGGPTGSSSSTTGVAQGESSTSGAPADTGSSPDGSSTSADFVMPPDLPSAAQCDVWAQDCPEGEKCMPWASNGRPSWNATRCTPLDPNPKQPGDECTVQGSDSSGIDDCALGSMCFAVDPETNMGNCVAFCEGSANSPVCEDSSQSCNISNDGVLILCLTTCDPLLQNCPSAGWPHGCYAVEDQFLCWPDYSYEAGAYGDACQYFNACDIGLFCVIPEAVPGCNAQYCCSQFCALDEPEACPDVAMGQSCLPWYAEGAAPPGAENIGFCGVMQ